MEERQLFTKEELTALYSACVFRGCNDGELGFEDEKLLNHVISKIQHSIPEVVNNHQEEPEKEQKDICRDG